MHVTELDIKIDVLWFPGVLVKERRPADEQYRPIPTLSQIPASFRLPFQTFTNFFTILKGIPQSFTPRTVSQYSPSHRICWYDWNFRMRTPQCACVTFKESTGAWLHFACHKSDTEHPGMKTFKVQRTPGENSSSLSQYTFYGSRNFITAFHSGASLVYVQSQTNQFHISFSYVHKDPC